jgi:hypothetical protein
MRIRTRQYSEPGPHSAQRRRTLFGIIALWLSPWLSAGAEAAGLAAKGPGSSGKRFLEFSKLATGHPKLDPAVGAALFAALAAHDRSFGAKVAALDEFAQRRQIIDVETLDAALQDNPLRAELISIIAAWYTGAVGEGARAKEVTYAGALMYEPSADGGHNPGFCAGATNSWGQLPRPPIDVLPKT